MLGVYFSGTGNSRHSLEVFCKEADANAKVISIEEEGVIDAIKGNDTLVISYPVQYSTVPIFLRDFVTDNSTLCYRCINNCPKKAITLLGKTVGEQIRIEKFVE